MEDLKKESHEYFKLRCTLENFTLLGFRSDMNNTTEVVIDPGYQIN